LTASGGVAGPRRFGWGPPITIERGKCAGERELRSYFHKEESGHSRGGRGAGDSEGEEPWTLQSGEKSHDKKGGVDVNAKDLDLQTDARSCSGRKFLGKENGRDDVLIKKKMGWTTKGI